MTNMNSAALNMSQNKLLDSSNRPSVSRGEPVERFLRVVRGRHKADIIITLGYDQRRFSELRRAIPAVTERVLARQLDALEQDGIISRHVHAQVPPRVDYALTEYGRSLCPLLKSIWKWDVTIGSQEES